MTRSLPDIYLGSILLESNRWKPGRRVPVGPVSKWSERAASAGFAGWELWENHYLLADGYERRALQIGALPVRVVNSYAVFDQTGEATRMASLSAVLDLPHATAMKFNVGAGAALAAEYRASIDWMAARFPARARLLCECHPGSALENSDRTRVFVETWTNCPFDVIIHPFLLAPDEITRWGKYFGARLKHAHVQMRDPVDPRRFVSLRNDAPRALDCIAALQAIGFAGSYTVEFARGVGEPDEDSAACFSSAVDDLEFLRHNL